MVENPLKAGEICRIIDKCNQGRITELTYGPLHLKFHPQGQAEQSQTLSQERPRRHDDIPQQIELPLESTEARLLDENELMEQALSQAAIEDPALYEKLHIAESFEMDRLDDETT